MRAFLIVDAVLVAVFLVVAALVVGGVLGGGGSNGDGDSAAGTQQGSSPGASTGPSPEASASASASGPAFESFATPTGNIACTMSADGVTCTIASFTYAAPGAEQCTGTIGHVVVAGSDGVSVPCVDGPAPVVAGADVPVLEYGFTSSVDGWTCTSGTNGVTCLEDASGTGFRLARAELVEVG